MKKIKTSMLAFALIAGISGAFITKVAHASKRSDSTYNWNSTTIAPDNPSSSLNGATVSGAVDYFGCTGGSQDCADGSRVSGTGPLTEQILFD